MDIESYTLAVKSKIGGFKRDWGIFFTPPWVIDFMVSLIDEDKICRSSIKILEPACGVCQFLFGIKRNKEHIFEEAEVKIGVDINKEVILCARKCACDVDIVCQDYLLWDSNELFDVIIGNPPYGIPSLSKHYTIRVSKKTKEKYKKIYETWRGKYNVYGAFIEKSVKLLKSGGQLIFIVPATFMILDEFKKLRHFLASQGKTEVIYMGGNVFKPEACVTKVVLKFVKSKGEKGKLFLLDYSNNSAKLVSKRDDWAGEVILFSTEFSKKLVERCSFSLGDVYTIRISPRTPEIKHSGDVVKSRDIPKGESFLPILNGKNLEIGRVVYESRSGYWILKERKTSLRKFFDKPHIVVGLGFRGNRQVGAAYDYRAYPWMGDVYHLLRKNDFISTCFDLEDVDVVKYLNSKIIRRYVEDIFRDITYHLSISQLKIIPLPRKVEYRDIYRVMM